MAYRMAELREKNPKAELRYRFVPYDRIATSLKRAMIAAEDAHFVEHEGFDWDGIQLALEKNQKKGRIVAGGSTITQQLAKNLFLSPARSYVRKAEEAVITLMLEAILDKQRIFELYLNVIEWGSGVFGAEAAAQRLFRHDGGAARRPSRRRGSLRWRRIRASTSATRPRPASTGRSASSWRACRRRSCRNMTPMPDTIDAPEKDRALPRERVEDALADITALLRKHRLVEGLVAEQRTAENGESNDAADVLRDSAVTRQNKAELVRKLDRLHAADIAHLLEAVPLDERLYVWDLVRAARDGDILLEVSDAVRESLISSMDTDELVAATETLEADEIAELAPDLPQEVMDDVLDSLPVEEREQLRAAMSFDEDMVGALMDFEDDQRAPRRDARGGAAVPPPLRRVADADRPGLRRRSRRQAAGRAADPSAARHRSGHAGARRDAAADRQAAAAREGR